MAERENETLGVASWTRAFVDAKGLEAPGKGPRISGRFVIEHVAATYGVPASQITERNQSPAVSIARHLCCYLMREMIGASYRTIANEMRRTDHTTAINSVRTVEKKIAADRAFAAEVAQLRAMIAESWQAYREALQVRNS